MHEDMFYNFGPYLANFWSIFVILRPSWSFLQKNASYIICLLIKNILVTNFGGIC